MKINIFNKILKLIIKNSNNGFTLIELLVAVSIIGIISVVSVRLLFSTVLARARQESIQTSSEDVRNFVDILSKRVKEAKRVSLNGTAQIDMEAKYVCDSFKLDGNYIVMSEINTLDCTAPSSGYTPITNSGTTITGLNFSQNGQQIDISISGNTKDAFGKHDFSYGTTVVKRTD